MGSGNINPNFSRCEILDGVRRVLRAFVQELGDLRVQLINGFLMVGNFHKEGRMQKEESNRIPIYEGAELVAVLFNLKADFSFRCHNGGLKLR